MDPKPSSPFEPKPGAQFVAYNRQAPATPPPPETLPTEVTPQVPSEISPAFSAPVTATPITSFSSPIMPSAGSFPPPPAPPIYQAPQSTMPPMPPVPPQSAPQFIPHASHKLPIVIMMVVIALLILAGGAYAAYSVVVSPANALPGTFAALGLDKKTHTDIVISIKSPNASISGMSLTVNTDMDSSIPGATSSDSLISVSAPYDGQTLSASGNIRLVKNVIYAELLTYPAQYAPMIAAYANKWYSVNLDTLTSLSSMYQASSTTVRGDVSLPPAEVFARFESAGVFKTSFSGLTMHNGQWVRKYTMTVDKDALLSLAERGMNEQAARSGTSNLSSVASQFNQYKMFADAIQFEPVHMYTSVVGGTLRGADAAIVITPPAGLSSASGDQAVTITMSMNYNGNNSAVSISAPTGATPLDSLFQQYANSLTNAKSSGMNARIISDIQQTRTTKEMAWDGRTGGYSSRCATDKTIQLLASDVKAQGSELICHESSSAYAIYAKQLDTGKSTGVQYFCIDSTGRSGLFPNAPTGMLCK